MAFDQSGLRWLGISDLIAEPEGPTFISYKVARRRLDRLRFVTQDPNRTSVPRVALGQSLTNGDLLPMTSYGVRTRIVISEGAAWLMNGDPQ
jgi:uncharacterized protein (DUF1800 family)